MSTNTIKILHISDLHIRKEAAGSTINQFDRSLVFDPFLARLKLDYAENQLRPELVIVSGDIAFQGDKTEYEQAAGFFREILDTLQLPAERLFVVPGNHDVNRKKYRPKDIPHYTDMQEINVELANMDYRSDLFKGLNEYFAFQQTNYPHLQIIDENLVPFVNVYPSAAGNIGLVGLNSAWMCRKSPDEREIAIGEYQLKHAVDAIRDCKDVQLILYIFHHPLQWLWPPDRKLCEGRFDRSLCLTGHLHDTEGCRQEGLQSEFLHLQAGGLYLDKGSTDEQPARYQYLTINLETGQLHLDFYAFDGEYKRWNLDGRRGKDGHKVFTLPDWKAKTALQTGRQADKPAQPTTPAIIPEPYKDYIIRECKHMVIDALREDTRALQLRLPEVYITLYTTAPGKTDDKQEPEPEKEQQPVDIEQLVGEQASLVIKGEAGCGKTTLLKHIAWSIIKGENRYGLDDHLPVLVYLRDFKQLLLQPLPEPCARNAEELLALYLEKKDCGLTLPDIKSFCAAGRTLLLLDGLDEVEDKLRDCLVQSFAAFAGRCPSLKLVYSGRPHGLSGALLKHYGGQVHEVLQFNEEQIAGFVKRWWQEVHEGDNSSRQQQAARALINDLAANADIADMKGNPLMLTAICFLYLDDKRLPDQRAELYDRFVRRLLVNRFPEEHKRLLQYFMELAHSMFTRGDKEIDRYRALQIFTPYHRKVEGTDAVDAKIRLEENFDWVEANSGLMQNRNNTYSFSHLSLQEFLTAAFIMDNVKADHKVEIIPWLNDSRYENVIRLYIGLLSVKGNKGIANQLVEYMLRVHSEPGTWLLAGSSLLDIHKDLRDNTTQALTVSKMEEIIAARAAPAALAKAGELLGWLGDRRDLKAFVKVKGGKYQLEGLGQVQLKDFAIGKYPVTNSWYGEFVADGGYAKQEHWIDEGLDLQTSKEVVKPLLKHDRQYNCPNAPIVGVSWYEAVAFTYWLTAYMQDGYIYRLPTEEEWQLAAGGKGQTVYPWGNKWDKDKCNNGETKLGKTTTVGIFKAGSTPVDEMRAEEIMDMAGNVWEWTGSYYGKDNDSYTLRGGAWCSNSIDCRCSYRYYDSHIRYYDVGFRCART